MDQDTEEEETLADELYREYRISVHPDSAHINGSSITSEIKKKDIHRVLKSNNPSCNFMLPLREQDMVLNFADQKLAAIVVTESYNPFSIPIGLVLSIKQEVNEKTQYDLVPFTNAVLGMNSKSHGLIFPGNLIKPQILYARTHHGPRKPTYFTFETLMIAVNLREIEALPSSKEIHLKLSLYYS